MRKISSALVVLLLLVAGCRGGTESEIDWLHLPLVSDDGLWVAAPSEGDLDGDVSSWGRVDRRSETLRIGEELVWAPWWTAEHKAILTFDTSEIPDDAEIGLVALFIGPESASPEDGEDWPAYMSEHAVIEVAGPGGFGGSAFFDGSALSAWDYRAPAAGRTGWVQDITMGAVHIDDWVNPTGLAELLDRDGLTQLRLGFEDNPEGRLVRFYSGDVDPWSEEDSPLPRPTLVVGLAGD